MTCITHLNFNWQSKPSILIVQTTHPQRLLQRTLQLNPTVPHICGINRGIESIRKTSSPASLIAPLARLNAPPRSQNRNYKVVEKKRSDVETESKGLQNKRSKSGSCVAAFPWSHARKVLQTPVACACIPFHSPVGERTCSSSDLVVV
jgi:hypothetical protein